MPWWRDAGSSIPGGFIDSTKQVEANEKKEKADQDRKKREASEREDREWIERNRSFTMPGLHAGQQSGRQLEGMTQAMKGMREIFGDAGRQGTVNELFEAMEQVTQGGVAHLNPAQLQHTVRQFQAAVSLGPGGMGNVKQNMANLQQAIGAAGSTARDMGLASEFGSQAAMQSAAFGNAWRDRAGPQGFGGLTAQDAQRLDTNLRLGAANSQTANAMGAIRAMQQAGVLKGASPDSRLGQIMTAMNEQDPAKRQQMLRESGLATMSQSDLMKELGGAGVDAGVASTFLGARRSNQEQVLKGGYANDVRGLQKQEVDRFMADSLGTVTGGQIARAGVDTQVRRQHQGKLNQAIVERLRQLANDPATKELVSNPENQARLAETIMQDPKVASAMEAMGLSGDKAQSIVATAVRSLGEQARDTPYGNLMSMMTESGQGTTDPAVKGGEGWTAPEAHQTVGGAAAETIARPAGGPGGLGGAGMPGEAGAAMPAGVGADGTAPAGGRGFSDLTEAVKRGLTNISGTLTIKADGTGEIQGQGAGTVPR